MNKQDNLQEKLKLEDLREEFYKRYPPPSSAVGSIGPMPSPYKPPEENRGKS